MGVARRNGNISFWYANTATPGQRPPLQGDRSADVCIVGAGFTGLWTAYYLKHARPDLDVVVLEREFAGFGASGRNGGWLSDRFATEFDQVAERHGRAGALALRSALRATIDEVIAVCEREAIDADIVKHGRLVVARGAAQEARLDEHLAEERALDDGSGDFELLDPDALARRIRVAGAGRGAWTPHCARVQPAKLVQGLATAVERLGVPIYEGTTVDEVVPHQARTNRGTVTADAVLTCLEGFTPSLRGQRRRWLPLNSAMVVTAPLPAPVWEEIGWEGEELLGDLAHAYCYGQRTADGRIALGGRGIPYRFGSRTDRDGRTQETTARQLAALLHELFPAAAAVPIDHAWCGVLGVPRDWSSTVRLDRATGLGTAGGYVGNGVTTTNLAGRTLRDLVLNEQTDLTSLPWVGHEARAWEPEPLRFTGVQLVYGLYRAADRREQQGRSGAAFTRIADLLAGR